MKTISFIQRPALLGLLASALMLGSGATALAQKPTTPPGATGGGSATTGANAAPAGKTESSAEPTFGGGGTAAGGTSGAGVPPAGDVENSDPFIKRGASAAKAPQAPPTAELFDAQARILFARNETEAAIALQRQAVDLARKTLARCTENLARYEGRPVEDGPIERKLRSIIIPAVNFEDISLEEAVEFLRRRCVELDTTEADPDRRGVNFVIGSMNNDPFGSGADAGQPGPTVRRLVLKNLSAADVLTHLGRITDTKYSIESGAVLISR